jgi:uncharacterized LabA/DUF88 family protein
MCDFGGVFLRENFSMSDLPRVVAFFDGQNLYRCAKEAFGYTYPNYDPVKLSQFVCHKQNWQLESVRFYTGIPKQSDDPFWNTFWVNKLANLGRKKVIVYKRYLARREKEIKTTSGIQKIPYLIEKGIDVRISIDIIRMALNKMYDVALLFSQDQDLSEVAQEIHNISKERGISIKIASAYPENLERSYNRGINKTEWIPLVKEEYDACIDPVDYRQ